MAARREGLRPLLPKPTKKVAKTNAEKCRDYRERLKLDPAKHEERLTKNREMAKRWRDQLALSAEEKERQREMARIRQQRRRDRLKQDQTISGGKIKVKTTPSKLTPTRAARRQEAEKAAVKKEKARLRQAKRRAKIKSNPQKYRREKEKRRERYHKFKCRKEQEKEKTGIKKRAKVALSVFLKDVKKSLQHSRNKLALLKLDFLKKIMARKNTEEPHKTFYKRAPKQWHSVERFFDKMSVDIPYKKGGSKPKKVLTNRLRDVYEGFRKEHPDVKMSFTAFKRKRPPHVLLAGSRQFMQCLCEKCVNTMLLVDVLNLYLQKKPESGPVNMESKITCVEELVDKTLCVNVTRECIERKCSQCGVQGLVSVIKEQVGERMSEVREWKRWEKTEKSPKDLVSRSDTVDSIISQLTSDLCSLAKHLKTAQWQRKQYQYFRDNLPIGHGMCTADFAENYLCKFQNEIQSAHWSYRQVSLHPCVFFYRCKQPACRKTITDYVVFISDDLKHDSAMTKCIFDRCLSYAESKGILSLQIFSDGCSSQYKSRLPFFHLSELQTLHPSLKLARHFFGSSHGKSLCDSCGGTVKNCAHRAVASGRLSIQNAQEMFDFCKSELTIAPTENCGEHLTRSFILIDPKEVDRTISSDEIKSVKGTRDIHCLVPSAKSMSLKVRALSCFCSVCLLGEEGVCENESFTLRWRNVNIERTVTAHASFKKNVTKSISSPEKSQTSLLQSSHSFSPENEVFEQTFASHNYLTRDEFFVEIYGQLSLCSSVEDVRQVALNMESEMKKFPLPTITVKSLVDVGGAIDSIALQLVPDSLKHLYPVLTHSDGNCVPRSLSFLVFGDQENHLEVRCRIVLELATHEKYYLSLDKNVLQTLCETSDFHCGNVQETFERELLDIKSVGTFMGLWQLMAASNILGTAVLSVYPKKGLQCHRQLLNQLVKPREQTSSNVLTVLWSSTRDDLPLQYWTANHVVPLMPISPSISEVVVES